VPTRRRRLVTLAIGATIGAHSELAVGDMHHDRMGTRGSPDTAAGTFARTCE
jgi:hypothetical protein